MCSQLKSHVAFLNDFSMQFDALSYYELLIAYTENNGFDADCQPIAQLILCVKSLA